MAVIWALLAILFLVCLVISVLVTPMLTGQLQTSLRRAGTAALVAYAIFIVSLFAALLTTSFWPFLAGLPLACELLLVSFWFLPWSPEDDDESDGGGGSGGGGSGDDLPPAPPGWWEDFEAGFRRRSNSRPLAKR